MLISSHNENERGIYKLLCLGVVVAGFHQVCCCETIYDSNRRVGLIPTSVSFLIPLGRRKRYYKLSME
jgi:hypothetical protein